MAIVENRSTEIGDVILIRADVPIIGLIALTDFIDSTDGETGSKLFKKQFRYSVDGFNFSNWIDLTVQNLQSVEVVSSDTFTIEYMYTRVGTDPTGYLTFNSVTFDGDFVSKPCGFTYSNSIFADFFGCGDTQVLGWAINVTEKLYRQGIVPKYIERGFQDSNSQDRDYIDFWRTVATFFAYFVIYARQFENFKSNPTLLLEYLRQRNLFICENEDIDDLLYLMTHYFDEIRQRGTLQIIKPKSDTKPVDGELLRLICHDTEDEFIFNINRPESFGWCIGESSPMYRSLFREQQVIKGYEITQDFVDLSKYPLKNKEYCSIVTDGFKNALSIDSSGLDAGIGLEDFGKTIKVDPTLDYEITFLVKQPLLANNITFGCKAYDINNTQILLKNIFTDIDTEFFFEKIRLNRDDTYYLVRGIIYNKNYGKDESDSFSISEDFHHYTLNIGYGNHLKFVDNIVKIIPQIYIDNAGDLDLSDSNSLYTPPSPQSDLLIWDFKIRPLATKYSKGFIQSNNFIDMILKNNNHNLSSEQLEEVIRRYLIPYNSTFKVSYI